MSVRLYVGNLPKEIDRKELQAVFAEAGESVTTKVITDRKTGKCRGFGFVTVKTEEEADQFIEKFNGYLFKETPLKIEKALPRSKNKGEEEQRSAAAPANANNPANSTPAPTPASTGKSSGGSERSSNSERGGSERRSSSKKNRRSSTTPAATSTSSSSSTSSSEVSQPDPRWAQALEELKKRLAAQASNP